MGYWVGLGLALVVNNANAEVTIHVYERGWHPYQWGSLYFNCPNGTMILSCSRENGSGITYPINTTTCIANFGYDESGWSTGGKFVALCARVCQ